MICRAVGSMRASLQGSQRSQWSTVPATRQQAPMGGVLSLDALSLMRIVASREEPCLEPVTQDNSTLAPPSARKKWLRHF